MLLLAAFSAVTVLLHAQAPADSPARPVIDRAALFHDLSRLADDNMEGRKAGTHGAARARGLIADRFRAAGLSAFGDGYGHSFDLPGGAGRGANMLGHLPGTALPARYIVVSAHYDHIGTRDGQVFNGANDNASGTAALPAIASYFAAHRPASSLLFAAFDAEEEGMLGARAFVRAPPIDRSAILIDINLDMIGRDATNTLYVVGTSRQPALVPIVDRVAGRAAVNLRRGYDSGPGDRDWTRMSDQWAFLEAGIPALLLSVEDFALHHHPDDDVESMTIDFYVRAVEAAIELIEEVDANAAAIAALGE